MIADLKDIDISERAKEKLKSRIEQFVMSMVELEFWQTDLQREVEAENERLTKRVHELAVALQKAEAEIDELKAALPADNAPS